MSLRGFNVPQLLGWDDRYLMIEMSIVVRPFVLDFAGAWLDEPPVFSLEAWHDWRREKRGQFGDRWEEVKKLLALLQMYGVFMYDVSPGNIAFGKSDENP